MTVPNNEIGSEAHDCLRNFDIITSPNSIIGGTLKYSALKVGEGPKLIVSEGSKKFSVFVSI